MHTARRVVAVLSLVVAGSLISSLAFAQASRTWVSGVGDDVNPCSRTAPCKTFAGAISKTAAGGEISVLDPGGFGAVTITKAITINGDGTLAGILASLTNGVIINAGVNDVIVLRNLSINGFTNGINGIRFLAGKQLVVENCSIQGFTNHGVDVSLGAVAAGGGQTAILNTTITNIGAVAIRVTSTSGTPTTRLDRVRIQRTSIGFDVLRGTATVADSYISHVTNQAIVAENSAEINVNDTTVSNNGTGISAFTSGSTVRLANVGIFNNTTGISIAAGGTVASFGNTRNAGNATPGAPNLTIPQQ